MYNGVKAMI